MRSLIWFRRDLRVTDNPALFYASQASDEGVIGLYLITPAQWKQHDDADCKVKFWLENVRALSETLREYRIPLLVVICDHFDDAPSQVLKVAKEHACSRLFFNREYEVNESRRDEAVVAACQLENISTESFDDRVIVPPGKVVSQSGGTYSVFTPFRKTWNRTINEYLQTCPTPKKQAAISVESSKVPDQLPGFDFSQYRSDLWPAGESEAAQRIENFVKKIGRYHQSRDIPSVNGTSVLSPYLSAGVASPRKCLSVALQENGGTTDGHQGPSTWISELAWRDFYSHILVSSPFVSMHQPFKTKTNAVGWRSDDSEFEAWKIGQTGYPIVDAGMRQLNQTGWMHNRLRMVTAMFLTKNLLIDWRLGERYFMQKLIDGDLAANNGGWQWSASTGTDAVPYFRIFNPFSQSKRFDADGEFIKKFCPELSDVPKNALHDPAKLTDSISQLGLQYPSFVVEYKMSRERALTAFKAIQ